MNKVKFLVNKIQFIGFLLLLYILEQIYKISNIVETLVTQQTNYRHHGGRPQQYQDQDPPNVQKAKKY